MSEESVEGKLYIHGLQCIVGIECTQFVKGTSTDSEEDQILMLFMWR